MPHQIVLKNVGYKRIENGDTFHVLKGIDFTVDAGLKVSLIGKNGSGKTTLVKILSGELIPEKFDAGKELVALVGTLDITQGKSKKNQQASGVATVHQFVQDDLINDLSVLKNIHIRQTFAGIKPGELVAAKILNTDLQKHGVLHGIKLDKLVKNLSGGEKQLLNVLIALQYECGGACSLLMLDEHLTALDVAARDKIEVLINEFLTSKDRPTVITVTHDLEMAVSNSVMIIAIKKDRTATCYDVKELLGKHGSKEKAILELKKEIIAE